MKITEADLPTVRDRVPELVRMNLDHLGSNRNTAVSLGSMGLEAAYRMQAIVSFLLDGSSDGFFHGMYLAACVRRRFLLCVRRGMRVKKTYLLLSHDAAIYEALCSGDTQVLLDLAKDKLTLESHPRYDDNHRPFFALGVRLLAMGKPDKARPPLDELERNRGGDMEGQARVARGILDGDDALFNDGLLRMMADRKAQIAEDHEVNAGEQWISVEGLGLARLGAMLGRTVTARHPLLPEELLGRRRAPFPDAGALLPPIPETFVDSLPREEEDE